MANIYVSSGTSFSATISITYPAGSTCTVSNHKKTWTAPNTSGSWTFKANEVGVYTVKAVSGSKSKEKEVLITAEGQSASAILSYELVLLDNTSGGLATGYSLSGKNITPAIDLTDYTLVTIKGTVIYTYASGNYTVWGLRKNSTDSLVASFTLNYDKNFSIDVSALTGNYFFGSANNNIKSVNNAIRNDATAAIGQVEYIKFS